MEIACMLATPDGAHLVYRVSRSAPPRPLIVLIHGLASNLTRWSELVRSSRLHDAWDLLRLDLRGFGGSLFRGPVGLEEWSRDLAAILAAEGASDAVLVGHCLGANIALHFAARYPGATRGLVLIEPMFREALTGSARLAARLRPLALGLRAVARGVAALHVHRGRLPSLDLEQLDREARAVMAAEGPQGFPENRYGSPREDLRFTPTVVYLAGLLAVTAAPPDLRAIHAPALALLSTGGRFGDVAVTARLLATMPRCEVTMIEARHWIPTERPREMREAIDDWCDRLVRAAS